MHRIYTFVLRVFTDPDRPEEWAGTLQAVERDTAQAFSTQAGLLALLVEQLRARCGEISPDQMAQDVNDITANAEPPSSTVLDS